MLVLQANNVRPTAQHAVASRNSNVWILISEYKTRSLTFGMTLRIWHSEFGTRSLKRGI